MPLPDKIYTLKPDEVRRGDFVIAIEHDGHTWGPGGISPRWQVDTVYTPRVSPPYRRTPTGHIQLAYVDGFSTVPEYALVTVGRKVAVDA